MPPPYTIVLSDVHLGFAPDGVASALHQFLERLPARAAHLIINGDLFEFWFEYRTVIPRAAFRTLAILRMVRDRGVRLTVIGGNHDRWGGSFWEGEMGAEFHPERALLEAHGFRCLVMHGDGVAEPARRSRALQRLVHHPLTARAFRWVHPDVGLRLVRRLAQRLPGKYNAAELIRRSAAAQARYARELLAQRQDVQLLILGHTHQPVLEPVGDGRWYLNPGAWMDGYCYAVIDHTGPRLEQWGG